MFHSNHNNDRGTESTTTSLITRGDAPTQNTSNVDEVAHARPRRRRSLVAEKQHRDALGRDGTNEAVASQSLTAEVNSFNGAGRLPNNYNEHTLDQDRQHESMASSSFVDLMMQGDVDVMNDGYPMEPATTTDAPTFLTQGQRTLQPIFDPSTPKNVTAIVGKSAYLHCRVRNLANKTVCRPCPAH